MKDEQNLSLHPLQCSHIESAPGENELDEPKFGVRQSDRNEMEEQSLCTDFGVRQPAVLGTPKSAGILFACQIQTRFWDKLEMPPRAHIASSSK